MSVPNSIPPASHVLLPDFRQRSPAGATLAGWLVYAAILCAALLLVPPGLPAGADRGLLATVGLVGAWRWSWAALHLVRSMLWRWAAFPRLRRLADAAPKPAGVAVLVTSYRMPAELNAAVYGSLFAELARLGVPGMVVACVTDPADIEMVEWLFHAQPGMPSGTVLRCMLQDGTGKRSAMAAGLHEIARRAWLPGSALVLMDGDTILTAGSLLRTCAVLMARPDVGAVTTDNIPLVKGHAVTREWYRLRLAHRDSLMCSMSLAGRVLVLTGRFSAFRAELATSAEFIDAITADTVRHGRLGDIRMVTGDDKSTWFALLRHGWKMLYVPDVAVLNVEELPGGGLWRSSISLMTRWYGNMVRNNGRAIRLGPRRVGWFTWSSLVDQRISPWTSLVGATTVLFACVVWSGSSLPCYVAWVLLTRLAICGLYRMTTGRFHALFPLILYVHQMLGAAIKIYMFFHPDRQGWNRQKVRGVGAVRPQVPAPLGRLHGGGRRHLRAFRRGLGRCRGRGHRAQAAGRRPGRIASRAAWPAADLEVAELCGLSLGGSPARVAAAEKGGEQQAVDADAGLVAQHQVGALDHLVPVHPDADTAIGLAGSVDRHFLVDAGPGTGNEAPSAAADAVPAARAAAGSVEVKLSRALRAPHQPGGEAERQFLRPAAARRLAAEQARQLAALGEVEAGREAHLVVQAAVLGIGGGPLLEPGAPIGAAVLPGLTEPWGKATRTPSAVGATLALPQTCETPGSASLNAAGRSIRVVMRRVPPHTSCANAERPKPSAPAATQAANAARAARCMAFCSCSRRPSIWVGQWAGNAAGMVRSQSQRRRMEAP